MTNRKSTKRALLSSALALILCFSMLLGTTYAWFTDSVTSANNIIKSGNLDVTLEYWDGDSWENVEASKDILSGDLWEPGYVDVAYLRIKNAGTLALKYQLGVNIVSEKFGVNKDGKNFKLSDYIYFDVFADVNGETAPFADRAAAMKDTTEKTLISAGYTQSGTLLAGSDYVYLAMVVYMPTTVDNVANHDGKTIPEIDLGINVMATQLAAESDSFGKDYDEDAVYYDTMVTTADELYAAVAAAKSGEVIAVDGNIVLTKKLSKSGLKSIKFVGWDDEATIDQATFNMHFSGAKVTFEGLTLTHGEKKYGDGGQTSTAFAVWNAAEVNYIDCTFNRSVGTLHASLHNFIGCTFNGVENPNNTKSEYPLYICHGQDFNVIDCVFNCTNRGAILFYNDGGSGVDTLNISNTKFLGDIIDDKTAVEIHNNSKSQTYNVNIKDVVVGNGVINGLYRIKPANVGEVNVTVDGVTNVATASDASSLTSAINNAAEGDTIYLNTDVNLGNTYLYVKNGVTLDLNGKELDSTAVRGVRLEEGTSIKNGTINSTATVAAIVVAGAIESIEDVTINVIPTAGKTTTGIQIYNGGKQVDVIRNVTMTGVTQGIEVAGSVSPSAKTTPAVGLIENVKIDATKYGMVVKGWIGEVKNSEIKGGEIGIYMQLLGEFKISLELNNCVVEGTKAALFAHDEAGISNTTNCSLTLTYDADTVMNGDFVWEFEDECQGVVTLNAPSNG